MSARVPFTFDRALWKPPERLSLAEWAAQHYYLSAESAAEPGRFRPFPYQVGIMNAISNPEIEEVSIMKSARVGATKIMNAVVGYYMHQDPCPIMVVQPTVEDAEGYSKEEIATMIRDSPTISEIFGTRGAKTSSDTILHKVYPGGSISMVGANSGRGMRRVSRKVVIGDERDAYPASAGSEGDPWRLAKRRAEFYWDRKYVSASTPLEQATSAINKDFLRGDQRYFLVPCPHCGHRDKLVFREEESGGHWMRWPRGRPEDAHFVCRECGCEILEADKRAMLDAGTWVATKPSKRHASFHIWAAYSYSPNATWGQIALEFEEANTAGVDALRTFVNTVLGQCWVERGEAPDWERLYNRREQYPIGTVPAGVVFLTCGVDVQRDRLVYEVVGWGHGRENWSIESGLILGRTSTPDEPVFDELTQLLNRTFPGVGGEFPIRMLAIDAGDNGNTVYNWARRHAGNRVLAVRGMPAQKTLVSTPSKVEVTVGGRKVGGRMWPIGVDVAKGELYGWLDLRRRENGNFPPGYCHFPEYGETYFQELTAEHLVAVTRKTGHVRLEWKVLPGRENHFLDCRVYARAAAALAGLDRLPAGATAQTSKAPKVSATPPAAPESPRLELPERAPVSREKPKRSLTRGDSWLRGGGGKSRKRGGWL